jgi:uncharacterized protein (UPF0276 family)
VGFGLRRELATKTFENEHSIDWLELVPENYMNIGGAAEERLERALASFPLVTHGINLSVGSTDDLNHDYLSSIKKFLDRINAPWWSDHLCFTSVEGVYMHDLLPLPFSHEAVKHVAERIKYVQDFVGRPFLLENISFYMNMPGCELSDAQFMSEVLEKADCGLLLDVNNVYVNSLNHKFDPHDYLNQIPMERTVQMHVAGHSNRRNHETTVVIDTHGSQVIQPVYDLLEYVLKRTEVKAVMLERDQNYPEFEELIAEINTIRDIVSRTQPSILNHKSKIADSIRKSA